MLVHPEISAILNRLSRTEREDPSTGPRVARGDKTSKGGSERPRSAALYDPARQDRQNEVDYLNERDSQVNFYA